MKNRIKELRIERNLTLRDLANIIGINYSTIGCYETEKREPNIDLLKKFTSFFEVSLDYICGGEKYIYCLYDSYNYKLSLSYNSFLKLNDYIYFNSNNHRCIDINKYLDIKDSANINDLISEFYKIEEINSLFNKKNPTCEDFNKIQNQDIILTTDLLEKIKSILK